MPYITRRTFWLDIVRKKVWWTITLVYAMLSTFTDLRNWFIPAPVQQRLHIDTLPSMPAWSYLVGFLLLMIVAIGEGGFHATLLEQKRGRRWKERARTSRAESQTAETEHWRAARQQFDREYMKCRHRFPDFIATLRLALARHDQKAAEDVEWAHVVLLALAPQAMESFSGRLFDDRLGLLTTEERQEFTAHFREIRLFFDHCQQLTQDFPTLAPGYVKERVVQSNFDLLDIVVQLARVQRQHTHGSMSQLLDAEPHLALWEAHYIEHRQNAV